MIRFEHVTRRYEPAGRPALDDVSVEVLRGEFVFLIGASGSGKSTLLRMIVREGLPQQGKITVAGQNLGLMLEHRVPAYRRSVGMVFQDFRLLPDKTVYDNVAFAMRVTGASRARIRQRVPEVLEKVGLSDLSRRLPHEISGGEQQRAAIARAMVNEPAVLLADEPTGNLDPHASDEVVRVLRRIHTGGTTVIMATHDRAIVDRAGRRVVQLHDGRLIRDDQRGTYDPRPGTEAWQLLRDVETTGTLRPIDPRATAPEPSAAAETDSADAVGGAATGSAPAAPPAPPAALARPGGKPVDAPLRPQSPPTTTAAAAEKPADAVDVSWPAHLRAPAAAEDVPEPAGDFTGSELPDLDRDGFVELDSGAPAASESVAGEPAAGESAADAPPAEAAPQPFLGRSTRDLPPEPTSVPKLSDVGWLAASGPPLPFRSTATADSASSAASPHRAGDDHAEPAEPAEPADDAEDGAPEALSEEREHDIIEDAVAEHSPQSAGPEGEAARPQTSWLPHADGQPIARPGVPHTTSAPSPTEPDVEDRRLAAQSTEDEPPVVDPAEDPHQGLGPEHRPWSTDSTDSQESAEPTTATGAGAVPSGPTAAEDEHDIIEDAVAEHSSQSAGPEGEAARPQTSWLPHADGQSIARPGVPHTASAPSPTEPDVEDRRLAAQSTEDEPPVVDPAEDPSPGRGPAREPRLQARRRAARPMTDREGSAEALEPTSSSAQATDEDARRTTDQPGGLRSIWRRLRRK
ncbi:cell division ATP-binding protein FtsE [Nesterenkonia halobia]|uniref:Cell division ATP-binding protein FtsE n=1 Tax=Nesterenkonia halobia TaxID=37922 RepID=A0ABP6RFN7_9MICC